MCSYLRARRIGTSNRLRFRLCFLYLVEQASEVLEGVETLVTNSEAIQQVS